MENNLVRIGFDLAEEFGEEIPFSHENLWAIPLGKGLYKLDNIPVFTTRSAYADVVECTEQSGSLIFNKVIKHSGNSTALIISDPALQEYESDLLKRLRAMGCISSSGTMGRIKVVSVSIPKKIGFRKAENVLIEFEMNYGISFEPGFVWKNPKSRATVLK